MSKIVDAFPFFNELDLLELRLNTLDKHVDYFLIQECDKTFQGNSKPLYYLENKDRFKRFHHKIIHSVLTDNIGDKWNNWDRDKEHKDYMINAMKDFTDDTIIISSDVDEIPNFDSNPIYSFYNSNNLYHMMQNFYYYYINYQKDEIWYGPKICSYKYFKTKNFSGIRNMKSEGIKISNGGWHFSFLGGVEAIKYKIQSWGHNEYNNDFILSHVEENIKLGKDIFYRSDARFKKVLIDNSYPKYLLDNLNNYKHWIIN